MGGTRWTAPAWATARPPGRGRGGGPVVDGGAGVVCLLLAVALAVVLLRPTGQTAADRRSR